VKLLCKEMLTVVLFTLYNSEFRTPTKKKIKIGYASVEGTQEFFCDRQTDHKRTEVNCTTFYINHEILFVRIIKLWKMACKGHAL
jgi:hypothetical protein